MASDPRSMFFEDGEEQEEGHALPPLCAPVPLAGKEHIVGIVGTRDFTDVEAVEEYVKSLVGGKVFLIVSGGNGVVDKTAVRVASACKLDTLEYTIGEEQAEDQKATFGQCAYRRNRKIVDVSGYVVAFWDGKSKGTRMVIDMCDKSGVPLQVIYPRKGKEHRGYTGEKIVEPPKFYNMDISPLSHAINHFITSRKKAWEEYENWEWGDYTDGAGTILDAYCTVRHWHPVKKEVDVLVYNFFESGERCSCESQFYNPQSRCKHTQARGARQIVRDMGIDPGSEEGRAKVVEILKNGEGDDGKENEQRGASEAGAFDE